MELLKYQDVTITYSGKAAVRDISFSLKQGEILGIVGESGSGKSTIIKAAMGLLGPGAMVSRGDISYSGNSLIDLSDKDRRSINGPQLGMIFQFAGASFCPVRRIGTQLYEIVRTHEDIGRAQCNDRIEDLFDKLGLKDIGRIMDSYPGELSGGMQQRLGIVAAMILGPKVLFADEPTSAMDATIQKQTVENMLRVREIYGTSIVLVTHNIGVVRVMADNLMVLKDGDIIEMGRTKDVINSPTKEYTKKLMAAVPRID